MRQTQPTTHLPELSPAELHTFFEEERQQSGVVYDPWSAEFRANPYPLLHTLRAQDPVHWSPLFAAWFLTRHRDVHTFLRQPSLSKDFRSARRNPLGRIGVALPPRGTPTSMLHRDPPDHTRLRSLVNKAFTSQAVKALRPRIQAIADELLDAVANRDSFDLIRDVANPLPVRVIAELLGVSPEDHEQFKVWTTDFVFGWSNPERRSAAYAQLMAYFKRAVTERQRHPRDDLVSALLAAQEAGDHLTEEELLDNCILLLLAGNETTTNLIGNGMLALLQHPTQWRLLQNDPQRMDRAVEELLRYDSPVQLIQRLATEETDVGGRRIMPRTMVVILIGAMNRDPEVFPNPDVLDVTRSDAGHVAFGYGIHYCLGAPLARAEASIAITSLLRRFPRLRPATKSPSWRPTLAFRGLEVLPVAANA